MKKRIAEWTAGACVFGAFCALYVWHGGASTLYLMLLAGWIVLSGMLLQWLGPRNVTVKRSISEPVITAGETAAMQVEIEFRSFLPVPWLAIEDYYTGGSSRHILFPGFRRRLSYRCELRSLPRGVYSFDACLLEWGGLFGWFKGERMQKSEGRLLVLPKPLPVARISESRAAEAFGAAQPAQMLERKHGIKGPEIRPYLPTDPLNRIHWKSYAKRGSLHAFLPEDERDPFCLVALDRSYDGYVAGEGTEDELRERAKLAFEHAVSAAAGILSEMMRSGAKGKLVCGASDLPLDQASSSVKPAKDRIPGGDGYSRMLAALSSLELSEGSSAASLAEASLNHAAGGTRVIIITGFPNEQTSAAAARLLARGVRVDLYCTALNAGIGAPDGKGEKHAGRTSAFAAAVRLSRMGAGTYAVHKDGVTRVGPIGPLRAGEGAV